MKYHVSVVPRYMLYFPSGQYFPQCCALRENIIPWENITLLAVHRNMIFHDCPGQYLYNIHPSKKVMQHHFGRLYQSVYGFIFIMLGIIWKLAYLSFHWYFICYDCFAETGAGWLNWVQCQKINVAKLDHNFNRWYQFVYETIFIVLGIIWKPIYFYFNWYIICYDCLSGTWAKWLY